MGGGAGAHLLFLSCHHSRVSMVNSHQLGGSMRKTASLLCADPSKRTIWWAHYNQAPWRHL